MSLAPRIGTVAFLLAPCLVALNTGCSNPARSPRDPVAAAALARDGGAILVPADGGAAQVPADGGWVKSPTDRGTARDGGSAKVVPSGVDDWETPPPEVGERAMRHVSSGMGAGAPAVKASPMGAVRSPTMAPAAPKAAERMAAAEPKMARDDLGFSTGGAKDVGAFRTNIEQGYVPHPSALSYEGLYYDYSFDTGKDRPCQALFCPSYARAVSRDPFSGTPVRYLTVGLNSNLKASDFARKKLNLVVVLDISGSMGSPFDEYYYDKGAAQKAEDKNARKINIATRSIAAMIDHLGPEDRLGVVLFDDTAYVGRKLKRFGDADSAKIKGHVLALRERGGTNMDAGITLGTELFAGVRGADPSQYENRIVFLTDAQPNTGDISESGLIGRTKANAEKGIYMTFIGIGVDFNTDLVSSITKVRGANYFAVHSSSDFKRRLADEFDFMVTPMVFDLDLTVDSRAYRIAGVYGSPEADMSTGSLMHVSTLFPSRTEAGETRGGVVLIELAPTGEQGDLKLRVSYRDRAGKPGNAEEVVSFGPTGAPADYFDNSGIRKAVLLARYASVLQAWMRQTRSSAAGQHGDPDVVKTAGIGFVAPERAGLSRWEQTSVPLAVSPTWRGVMGDLATHVDAEAAQIGDKKLAQESAVLRKLAGTTATIAR
jgi:Ca-activated chloride channel homolog